MRRDFPYTESLGEYIAFQVASGRYLPAISLDPNMPDMLTMQRWLNKHEKFRELISLAERARSEIHQSRIADDIEGMEKEEARFQALKYLAQSDNPGKFSGKESALQGGVTVIVNTGVPPGGYGGAPLPEREVTPIESSPQKELSDDKGS